VIITVDVDSGVPPYEQMRGQIARMIGAGVLAPGTRLPTIAQLANDLQVAPGTVARAYKELERDRLVASRRRTGTVVADHPPVTATRGIREELDAAAERFVVEIRQLGADPDDAVARVRALLLRAVG
jgi:GntR family transcriptional regulator